MYGIVLWQTDLKHILIEFIINNIFLVNLPHIKYSGNFWELARLLGRVSLSFLEIAFNYHLIVGVIHFFLEIYLNISTSLTKYIKVSHNIVPFGVNFIQFE